MNVVASDHVYMSLKLYNNFRHMSYKNISYVTKDSSKL